MKNIFLKKSCVKNMFKKIFYQKYFQNKYFQKNTFAKFISKKNTFAKHIFEKQGGSEARLLPAGPMLIPSDIAMAMQCYLHTNNRNIMTGFNAILLTLNCLQLRCNIYNMKCETLICNENEN